MTEKYNSAAIHKHISQGKGDEKADLVLKGGSYFDLVSGALINSDIAISDDMIVGVGATYHGKIEIDVAGKVLVPGFIDTHLHVESSLVTPMEFDRCVLRHGVTTAICDPHEIANVVGAPGIRYFLDCAEHTIMDLRVQLSSCVPATHLETSGASLDASVLVALRDHPKVIGLAEFMNYPGVLNFDPVCLEKLEAFSGGHIDGHAPLLRGKDLNGYLSAGVLTDHEATTAEEALEKLQKGMTILVREGSVSKDLHALLPIITERHSPYLALCTDDRNPLDIADEGHLDFMIREAIAHGVEPLAIYRAASVSAARAFGLRDRGLIAPGYRADINVLDGLESCRVTDVISAGRIVSDKTFRLRHSPKPVGRDSVQARKVSAADFNVAPRGVEFPVIGVNSGKIITQHLSFKLPSNENGLQVDLAQDAIKVAVIERHGKNGNMATGFVHGFGLQRGAIASTVGHDCHNITVVGENDDDMALAANHLSDIEGGFVVVSDGKVLASLPLPIAGLMSDQPYEWVRDELRGLRQAALSLGTKLPEPFLQVAFLPLPVIPHLKITDKGLVDVDRFILLN